MFKNARFGSSSVYEDFLGKFGSNSFVVIMFTLLPNRTNMLQYPGLRNLDTPKHCQMIIIPLQPLELDTLWD